MFCNDHKCSCDRNELIDPMDTVSVIRRRVCKYMSIIMSCCHPSSSYKTACSDNNIFAESVKIECASKYKCFRNGLNVVHKLCISVSHVVRNAQLFPDLEFRILHKNRMHFCWYTQKQINIVTMHKAWQIPLEALDTFQNFFRVRIFCNFLKTNVKAVLWCCPVQRKLPLYFDIT